MSASNQRWGERGGSEKSTRCLCLIRECAGAVAGTHASTAKNMLVNAGQSCFAHLDPSETVDEMLQKIHLIIR